MWRTAANAPGRPPRYLLWTMPCGTSLLFSHRTVLNRERLMPIKCISNAVLHNIRLGKD